MRIDQFTFGSIRIDGVIYEHDVVIQRAGGTVIDVLKVAVIVLLVVLVVLLGIPFGMPMSGASMCPECGPAATWGAMCVALLASVVLLVQRRGWRILVDRSSRPILVSADVLERPPRLSS